MNQSTPPAGDRLSALAQRYWRFECEESPLTALLAGEPNNSPAMFRSSQGDHRRRDGVYAALADELKTIPIEALGRQERTTYVLLERELEAVREQFAVESHLRPWLLPVGPEFNAVFFANSSTIATAEEADLYVTRLESIPSFLRDVEDNIRAGQEGGFRYPRPVVEAAIPNVLATGRVEAEDSAWLGPFRRSAVAGYGPVQVQAERAARAVRELINPAFAAYAAYLEDHVLIKARETIACTDAPLGRAYYQTFVKFFTTTEQGPDLVHELGLAEVERLRLALQRVAAESGHSGDIEDYRRFLAQDPGFVAPDANILRERMEVICKRIDRRIPAFFSRLPRITYGVETIPPAIARNLPPAYAQPGPADNSSAGVLWITSLAERCPSHMLLPLALHEGWPGHLMHIALLQESEGLPAFRRNNAVKYTVMVEGWALYCEWLGIEMGLYENPEQHFGRLEMELWRAARLVVDTGIHWKGWGRNAAIAYMRENLSLPIETIEQEVDRYIAMPGQALAYQIGNLKFREVRQRAEDALGTLFSIREFHRLVTGAGAVTLPILEALVDDWINVQRAAPRSAAA